MAYWSRFFSGSSAVSLCRYAQRMSSSSRVFADLRRMPRLTTCRTQHKEKKSSKGSRESYAFGLKAPSPITFSIIRLAVAYYLNEVAAEPLLSFKSE